MEVTSLREPKMADRVATQLRRMFIRGEIAEGTMLPPESELMERFGVSRPTLREAFRVLESESLIVVQRGVRGGARVTRPRRKTLARYAGLILEYEGVTLKDVYDARVTLETPMVGAPVNGLRNPDSGIDITTVASVRLAARNSIPNRICIAAGVSMSCWTSRSCTSVIREDQRPWTVRPQSARTPRPFADASSTARRPARRRRP